MDQKYLARVFLLLPLFFVSIHSHGRLMNPPGRSTMWRFGFKTPANYNDHELNCGGRGRQHQTNKGKCGVCGDPYDTPRPRRNEHGGRYGTGTISRSYRQGEVIDVEMEITANHFGWLEFKLCPINGNSGKETQECFDKYPLYLAENPRETKYNLQAGQRTVRYKVKLPPNVVCSQCVVQWAWRCGNSPPLSGPQEWFYGCSDIEIKGTGGGTGGGTDDGTDGGTGGGTGITQDKSCKVREKATNKLTQCEFPFKFKGETHNGCIDYVDIRRGKKVPGEPWCSTKVRGSNREHVTGGGHYGECSSSCKTITPEKSCKVREKSSNKLTQCEFPFKFKGRTHNSCIDYVDILPGGKEVKGEPWCSTKVSGSDRKHVSGGGHYGDCDSSCEPQDPRSPTQPLRTPLATQAVFVDDPSNPYGRSQLVVTSQLCIPKKGYRNSTMGQWCQENCLKYPPNCDTNLCECLDECKAVGDSAKEEWSDLNCNKKCIHYPFSPKDCPEDKCRCSFLKPEPEVEFFYSPDPNSAQ